jgi:hypothetical protein
VELVDSSMLPGLAVDNHSGLRWGVGNQVLSVGVDCCRTPRCSGLDCHGVFGQWALLK